MAKVVYLQMWILFDIWCGKLCKLSWIKFTDLEIKDRPVHNLQVCKSVFIDIFLSNWQTVFHIKC